MGRFATLEGTGYECSGGAEVSQCAGVYSVRFESSPHDKITSRTEQTNTHAASLRKGKRLKNPEWNCLVVIPIRLQ